ncbi:MAG: DMT family transporter [Phycisphaerales bacterium]|nr:DMT family transporter [Phycisphaerales bacterium]
MVALSTKNKIIGSFFALMGILLFSTHLLLGYVQSHQRSEELSPISLTFYRWATTFLFLLPFTIKDIKKHHQLIIKHAFYFLSLGGTLALSNVAIYWGYHHSEPILVNLFAVATSPVFTILISFLFLKEVIPINKWVALIITFIACIILIANGSLDNLTHLRSRMYDFIPLIHGLGMAIYAIFSKRSVQQISLVTFLCIIALGATLLSLILAIGQSFEQHVFFVPSLYTSWITILWLGILVGFAGYFLWSKAIRIINPTSTILFFYFLPVFAQIEMYIYNPNLHKIGLVQWFSIALIIIGIIINNLKTPLYKIHKRHGT